MQKILMLEGNTLSKQAKARELGLRTATETYQRAVRFWNKEVQMDVINAADGEMLPDGADYADYAGMIISGSSLRAFEETPEVLNQLEALRRFSETGKPILGSCWGLQIAAVVAGGKVGPSDKGREIGLSRKVALTPAGQSHPFMQGKPLVYDAPAIHYDEVTQLPDNAVLLCGNAHSQVQGAIVPVGKSEVWGVQYHPEFDLNDLRLLFTFYRDDMFKQGFVNNDDEYNQLLDKIQQLENDTTNKALAWQLGYDDDVLVESTRSIEIKNWLAHTLD